jgi:hypothetical protein
MSNTLSGCMPEDDTIACGGESVLTSGQSRLLMDRITNHIMITIRDTPSPSKVKKWGNITYFVSPLAGHAPHPSNTVSKIFFFCTCVALWFFSHVSVYGFSFWACFAGVWVWVLSRMVSCLLSHACCCVRIRVPTVRVFCVVCVVCVVFRH